MPTRELDIAYSPSRKSTCALLASVACVVMVLGGAKVGCHFKPSKPKSPVEIPERFSSRGGAKLPDRWWRAFEDRTLNALVTDALQGNMSIKAVWDRLDQAAAQARKAGAGLYPSVDGRVEGGVSFSEERQTPIPGGAGAVSSGGVVPNLLIGVAASYEIDIWGRVRSTRNAARREVAATRESLQAAAVSLSGEVAVAWYGLLEAYGQLRLLERQAEANQRLLKLVALRMGYGQTGAIDLLQQKQLIESIQSDLMGATVRARLLEHRLAVLLGRPPTVRVVPAGARRRELPGLPDLPDPGVPAELVQRRPDVRAAFHRIEAANEQVAAAIADRFPRLSISAGAQVSDDGVKDLFNNWLVSLAANLLAPIFDGGRRKAEVDRAKAAASEALHDYGQTVLEAIAEVEGALVTEKHARRRLESIEKQLELSNRVVDRARDNYVHGAGDYLRVLDARIKHQSLQRAHLTLRREIIENRIALCRALAGGWKLRRPKQGSGGKK